MQINFKRRNCKVVVLVGANTVNNELKTTQIRRTPMNNYSPKAVANALMKPIKEAKASDRYTLKRPLSSHYQRSKQQNKGVGGGTAQSTKNNAAATTATMVISHNNIPEKVDLIP